MGNDVSVYRLSYNLRTRVGRKNLLAELRWALKRPLVKERLHIFLRAIVPLCVRDTLHIVRR